MAESIFPIVLKEEHLPNATFFQWLKSNTALFISQIAALVSIIAFITAFIYYFSHDASDLLKNTSGLRDSFTTIIFLSNVVFSIVFILTSIYILRYNNFDYKTIKFFSVRCFNARVNKFQIDSSYQLLISFRKWFLAYWVYVLIFYVINKEISPFYENGAIQSFPLLLFIRYLLGNCLFFIIYHQIIIVFNSAHISYSKLNINRSVLLKKAAPAVLYLLLAASYIVIFMFMKNKPIALLNMISGAVTGIANMIALTMLIARFDSKLIGLPSWLISIMYCYAAIQPLDVFLDIKSTGIYYIATVMDFAISFIFRTYFFLIFTYTIQTGRLTNYFCCSGLMSKRIHTWRNNLQGT